MITLDRVVLETLAHGDDVAYRGWSKFDGLRSPMTAALSFGAWPVRLAWTQLVMRSPVNLRPILGVRPGVNPEAPALFARANLDAAEAGLEGPFLERAVRALGWLLDHDSSRAPDHQPRYRGRCWGYHHAWQNTGFYQPPGYPNCYLTAIVTGALLHGHRVLGRPEYLEAARSAAEFMLGDLPVFEEDDEEKCIAYVPDMRMSLRVININALAAATLAELAAATGEAELLHQARKLMTFVVNRQTADGAWYYATQPTQSLVAHDNYHTGMILDALMTYRKALNDDSFVEPLERGLTFYRAGLFEPSGAPRWSSARPLPHDAHGSGQGTLTFALAGDLATAERVARWGVAAFYKGNGEFCYQRGRFLTRGFTLLHWSSGWMVRGLAALLRAQRHQSARAGHPLPAGVPLRAGRTVAPSGA